MIKKPEETTSGFLFNADDIKSEAIFYLDYLQIIVFLLF
ncbi:hypothetical protein NU09_3445 [Flavobacterium beibuense]|uniref:Uncharacterized protein n=1 Tax=Flavobacterium beibuense TaxID=657326 RepID=A0A444W3P7_9FLAO|nr:hypothetical protein NU09_3445 [Flavobacterium beibuense]